MNGMDVIAGLCRLANLRCGSLALSPSLAPLVPPLSRRGRGGGPACRQAGERAPRKHHIITTPHQPLPPRPSVAPSLRLLLGA